MFHHKLMTIVSDAWLGFLVVWLIAALKVKQMKYVAPFYVRAIQLLFLVPGCLLLFAQHYRVGPLHDSVLPEMPSLGVIGVVLTFAGIAFAFWARYSLGSNWSSQVAIRENHELIQSGPYRWIRHPIYTGIIAAAWGTALVVGELGAFVGVILVTMGFAYKGKQEELNLHRTFGESWNQHRQRTGMFLPKRR